MQCFVINCNLHHSVQTEIYLYKQNVAEVHMQLHRPTLYAELAPDHL